MAINSENKRRAAWGLPFLNILPVSDGTVDPDDRRIVLGVYPGIASIGGMSDNQTPLIAYAINYKKKKMYAGGRR